MDSGSESEAPEELTAGEGIKQHEQITKAHRDHLIRAAKEGKARRRKWAQNKTAPKSEKKIHQEALLNNVDQEPEEEEEEERLLPGMLPKDILAILAAREKQTFSSDSEEEIVDNKGASKKKKNRKRRNNNGTETVVLSDIPPPPCLQSSIDFLKRRKMQIPRSTSILKNADRALCLLSSKGGLLGKS